MRVGRAWLFVCASFAFGAMPVLARAPEPPLPAPAWGTGAYDARKIQAQQMAASLGTELGRHFSG